MTILTALLYVAYLLWLEREYRKPLGKKYPRYSYTGDDYDEFTGNLIPRNAVWIDTE